MINKVVKKSWLQITGFLNLWATTEVETSESLENTEKFINNTWIIKSLMHIKNNLFWDKIKNNAVNVIWWTEKKILESWFKWERKEIPTKIAVNLIKNSSLEDWEKLQDIWSNMLANAVTWKVDVENSYIDILTQLTDSDISFLNFIFDLIESQKIRDWSFDLKNKWFSKQLFIDNLKVSNEKFEIIIDSLIRLNLIHTANWNVEWSKDTTYVSIHMQRGLILLTHLWYEFVKACKFK